MLDITVFLNEDRLGIHALQSSNKLARFKVHEQLSRVHFLPPHYLIASSLKKPILYVWNMFQDSSVQKYVLPGMALSLATSPCGKYIAVGVDNTVKFWHLPTGQLVNTVSNHYQKVTSLVWSHDGRLVVSGGADNNVNVWEFHKIVGLESGVSPLFTLTNHSLPVSDLYCGQGGAKSRLFTSSLDNTCNVYELSTGKLIISLEFPAPIFKLLVDKCETYVMAVTVSTDVYKVSLMDAIDTDVSKDMKPFIRSPHKITCCCLTEEDSAVILGTTTTDFSKYCVVTGQQLPYSFKPRTPVDDVLTVTLSSYKRNDKPAPFPFPRMLQRATTGVLSECSLVLQPEPPQLDMCSDEEYLAMVREAVREEKNDAAELRGRLGEMGAISEELIKFASERILGS